MSLSPTDRGVIDLVTQELHAGQDPRLRLGARASAVAVDRWGRDLERDVGEQEYAAFDDALAKAAADVLDHYADADADVDGVEGYVFEGRVIDAELLTATAELVTEEIEAAVDFDRDEPGGLVEPVDAPGGEP